ncbi:hypothetical protein BASA81_000942 [Batrachochytrium salamandrivorans]|nr:hypothetical protein BASA81_000942 [Batrachochytrium salamandrivorans]
MAEAASSPPPAAAAAAVATVTSTYTLKLDSHTDGISGLYFNPNSSSASQLLVTSWDGGATVYSTANLSSPLSKEVTSRIRFPHAAAVLCGAFTSSNGDRIVTGGVECAVRLFNLAALVDANANRVLGTHDAPVRCLTAATGVNGLLSGSWDRSAKLWDDRSLACEVATISLGERVFAQDVDGVLAVFGLGDGTVVGYDLRQLDSPVFARPSTLGHQIRSLKLVEHGQAMLIGSIEGRVAVENISQKLAPKRYAFKCHRQDDWIFPVNAIAVPPSSSSSVFATGGGDGTVCLWDSMLKKKLLQFPKLETSCSALAFSPHSSNLLAISQSYAFERGDVASPPPDQVLLCEFDM